MKAIVAEGGIPHEGDCCQRRNTSWRRLLPKEEYLMKAIDAKGGITEGGKLIVWRARANLCTEM